MDYVLPLTLGCGVLALIYGIVAGRSVLAADAGSERMREIAGAIQEGAAAYLNRQYSTIGIVGVVVAVVLWITLKHWVALGFVIGALLSVPPATSACTCPCVRTSARRRPRPGGCDPRSISRSGPARSPGCLSSASACSVLPATTRSSVRSASSSASSSRPWSRSRSAAP